MPSLEQLYRQDPESLAFRQPVDVRVVLVSLLCLLVFVSTSG